MHGLEQKYAGEVRFVYLDIDDPRTTPFKEELAYRVQPHLFLLDGEGNVVREWLGLVAEAELDAALEGIVNSEQEIGDREQGTGDGEQWTVGRA